jgi:exopolyphosphatase/guanosine-5'-triphosphate,3'-diphosphate pyrophosphatase
VRVARTSASRDAANRDEFFDAVEDVIGTRPELLSGEEEDACRFLGATGDPRPRLGPFLIVDIGGGSTEFIAGTDEVEGVISVDVGCVRMTEKFLEHDPPMPEELTAASASSTPYLEDVRASCPAAARPARWSAWPARSRRWPRWRSGWPSTTATASTTSGSPATRPRTCSARWPPRPGRPHPQPGLEEARADVIVGGCCVLVALFRRFGFDEMIVSEADILDGWR